MRILINLRIKASKSLYQKFQNENLNFYLTLTLFFTVFASCLVPDNSIYLASKKKLSRRICSIIEHYLFDHINTLKINLIFVSIASKKTFSEAAALMKELLSKIMQILKNLNSNLMKQH